MVLDSPLFFARLALSLRDLRLHVDFCACTLEIIESFKQALGSDEQKLDSQLKRAERVEDIERAEKEGRGKRRREKL